MDNERDDKPQCTCARFPEPHARQRLCRIGFNEFLGEVQHRLIKAGYNPPLWPDPKIDGQGDMDSALDSCVQWCADRLAPSAKGRDIPQGARAVELLREAQKRVSRKWRGHQFDALWLEINDYLASPQPINKETK